MKRIGLIAIAVVLALMFVFGAGWFYGSRRAAAQVAGETNAAYALGLARGSVLEGRLELYSNNFGNAARHFDAARRELARAVEFLEREHVMDQASSLREATASIETSIQRAGRLEPAAHESAAAAQRAIDAVLAQRRPPTP